MLRETIPFRPDPSVPTRHGKHICRYDGIGRRSGLKIRRQRWRAGSTPATGTTSAHLAHGSENPIAFRGRVFCVWASGRLLPAEARFDGDLFFPHPAFASFCLSRISLTFIHENVRIRFPVRFAALIRLSSGSGFRLSRMEPARINSSESGAAAPQGHPARSARGSAPLCAAGGRPGPAADYPGQSDAPRA